MENAWKVLGGYGCWYGGVLTGLYCMFGYLAWAFWMLGVGRRLDIGGGVEELRACVGDIR